MKRCLLFFFVLLISSVYLKAENPGLQLKVKLTDIYKKKSKTSIDYFWDAEFELYNSSDTIVKAVVYTCSWGNSFIDELSKLNFGTVDCDHNFPEVKEILPRQSVKYNTYYHYTYNKSKRQRQVTRIGFIWFKTIEEMDQLIVKDDVQGINVRLKRNIIWSNPIKLP